MAVEAGEEERREVPDRFRRADLAQAAAGEAAPDGEGQRAPFAGEDGGMPSMTPTMAPGVGAGEQSGEEGARQRQIGGVVVEQEPRDDPGGEREAQAGGENQPLRPVPLFGQQDPPEPRKPHQHRRQHRPDGELGHQREQQDLLGLSRVF